MSSAGQIGSIICKNFAQNAWKKDLCSNCFKSEVEHQESAISSGSSQALVSETKPNPSQKDIKLKTVSNNPNLLTNGNSDHSSIKALNINISQTNGNKFSNKSVNDCQNTTSTSLQKKSINSSPQILLNNTKKINSTHVLSQNPSDNSNKLSDKPSKDSIKDIHLNNNSINNCFELRKVINSKVSNGEENLFINNSKVFNNNNNSNNHLMTKDPKQSTFPQKLTKEKTISSETNVNNNNSLTDTQVLNKNYKMKTTVNNCSVDNKTIPLIGILKTDSNKGLIKYRPKNKCLVFKEGDPMVIGFDRFIDDYGSDEENSDDCEETEESDDEQLYYSDDKELRELTRENTKFNSNFANFSIKNLNEKKVKELVDETDVRPILETNDVSNDDNCVVSEVIVLSNGIKEESIVLSNGIKEESIVLSNGIKEESIVSSNGLKEESIVSGNDVKEESNEINEEKSCVTEVNIPEVCEKLVESSLIETLEEISDANSVIMCESIKSLSPDSSNSDILPMSSSSDTYSSSSSDEKEDSLNSETQTTDNNFKTHLIITQNVKPLLESKHLRTDSESDNSSTNSDSGLEIKDYKRRQESNKPQISRTKPQLPVKPNISTIIMNSNNICIENETKIIQMTNTETDSKSSDGEDNISISSGQSSGQSSVHIIADQIYQEICDSSEGMHGIEGKYSINFDSNSVQTNGKTIGLEVKSVNEVKRDIKLAELAHELEQVRHMKRPAPQPPVINKHINDNHIMTEMETKEDISLEVKPIDKQPVNTTNDITDRKTSLISSNINTNPIPTKPHRFSIRKLLHKKSSSDKQITVKTRDHSNDSQNSTNSTDQSCADRKAWKQSEFNRSTIKIVHPIDMTNDKKTFAFGQHVDQQNLPEQRPEAPPRTPKPCRPSVPVRKRKQLANPHLIQAPRGEPPPPPPPTTPPPPPPPLIDHYLVALKDSSVKNNDLSQAYNQLAKSNFSNLLAIKSNIETIHKENDYKWSDFEVTNAIRLGSALLYKESIVSKTKKSIDLLVLPNCHCSPLVTQFRYHSDLVLVFEEQWTQYFLLSKMCTELEPKLMNSLILQLYLILEELEKSERNLLPNNLIDKILICASEEDCLLIIPLDRSESVSSVNSLTVHQFLGHVLAKLLPNSLFGTIDLQILSRASVPISQSKTIVQLIVFQIPVHQMSDIENNDQQINYWFDINRSKFINQFCCLSVGPTKLLTHLDYNYLKFLCNENIELIRTSIALLVNTTNETQNL